MRGKALPYIAVSLAMSGLAPKPISASLKYAYQDLDIAINRHVNEHAAWMMGPRAGSRHYPSRILRYFLPYAYLRTRAKQLGRPLNVCEIGVGAGQMASYYEAAMSFPGESSFVDAWLGVDIISDWPKNALYTDQRNLNLNEEEAPGGYDVYLLLHVIEHLTDPEVALDKLVGHFQPGTQLIIGVPCHLHAAIAHRERRYQEIKTFAFGHVSALSRRRLVDWSQQAGMNIVFEDGAFFVRASGLFLEDSKAWQSFNLAFGRLFPGFPSEYYCCLEKSA